MGRLLLKRGDYEVYRAGMGYVIIKTGVHLKDFSIHLDTTQEVADELEKLCG